MTFDHLDKLKQQLDSHRPLPHAVVSNLHESLVLQWTYHSNAIEGNTLTLKETKVALEGITVGGNGRTSRLLMNLELMKSGFPAAVLTVEQRLEYYEALDKAHCDNDYEPFLALIASVVETSFAPYWWALGA